MNKISKSQFENFKSQVEQEILDALETKRKVLYREGSSSARTVSVVRLKASTLEADWNCPHCGKTIHESWKVFEYTPSQNICFEEECPKCGKTIKVDNTTIINLHD